MKTGRANAIRFQARFGAVLILLAASGLTGRAQGTNAPGRPDYQAFKILTERNIFDPNRSSDSGTRGEPRRTARMEFFALVGTLSYQKGNFAFFDGSGSAYRKALETGDRIAGYKIAEITAERVKLEADGKQVLLNVGMQMKKQDEGEWQLAGRAESLAASVPATASNEKTESSSGGEESDVLKKLMQKREQELK